MLNSETSSTTVAEELSIFEQYESHTPDPAVSKTTACIIPEATDRSQQLDLEKAPVKSGMHDAKSFPDGGWEAWLVVSGAFCVMFCSFGWINCEYSNG